MVRLSKTTALAGALLVMGPLHSAVGQEALRLRPALGPNPAVTQTTAGNLATTTPPRLETQALTAGAGTNAPRPPQLLTTQPQQIAPVPQTRAATAEEDPYAPLGIRAGTFKFLPVLEVTGVFTNNVRARSNGGSNDFGLRLAPSLTLESEWSRHSLTINATGESIFYLNNTEMNSHIASATSTLRLDMSKQTTITTTGTYNLTKTSSASSQVPGTAIGDRRDHEVSFSSAVAHKFNRLTATLTGGARWLFYDNLALVGGGVENNSDREYVEPNAVFRLGYEISPAITPFVEASYTPRFHRRTRDRNNQARNSLGFEGKAGFAFNLSPIWDGEVGFVYDYRSYADPTLAAIRAFGLDAMINWRPTQLTTISLTANTGISESAILGVSGVRNYDLALDVSHKFRDNITGTFNASFNYDDLVGGANDFTFAVQPGFTYTFNRYVQWLGNYNYTYFLSGSGSSYTAHSVTTGLQFRL